MMDYGTIAAQVLALLQQEKRVACRVLKRRLQLDDESVLPPACVRLGMYVF